MYNAPRLIILDGSLVHSHVTQMLSLISRSNVPLAMALEFEINGGFLAASAPLGGTASFCPELPKLLYQKIGAAHAGLRRAVDLVVKHGKDALPTDPRTRGHVLSVFVLEAVYKEILGLGQRNNGWIGSADFDPEDHDVNSGFPLRSKTLDLEYGSQPHDDPFFVFNHFYKGTREVWVCGVHEVEAGLNVGLDIGPHGLINRHSIAALKSEGAGAGKSRRGLQELVITGVNTFRAMYLGSAFLLASDERILPKATLTESLFGRSRQLLMEGMRQFGAKMAVLSSISVDDLVGKVFLEAGIMEHGLRDQDGNLQWHQYERLWNISYTDGPRGPQIKIDFSNPVRDILMSLERTDKIAICPAAVARTGKISILKAECRRLQHVVNEGLCAWAERRIANSDTPVFLPT